MLKEQIFVQSDLDRPFSFETPDGQVVLYTRRSPDRETSNEDSIASWVLSNGILVLAVADGMGGAPSGNKASAIAIQTLGEKLHSANSSENIRSKIIDAFEETNKEIQKLGSGAGTTLTTAEIQNHVLRIYHVGDSMGLCVGQRGKLKLETISHSPVGHGERAGIIGPEEALHHEERNYLFNFLGSREMYIQLGTSITLNKYDTLLIASDGLNDNFLLTEIIDSIRTGPLEKCAEELADHCIDRMTSSSAEFSKPDDLSFILYRRRN